MDRARHRDRGHAPPPHPDGLGRRAHPAALRRASRHRRARDELRAVSSPTASRCPGVRRGVRRGGPSHGVAQPRAPDAAGDEQPAARPGGPRGPRRTRFTEGDNVFVALSWSKHPAPGIFEEAATRCGRPASAGGSGSTSATSRITRGGRIGAQRADAEGPDVLADRRAAGGELPPGFRNARARRIGTTATRGARSTFASRGRYTLVCREADDFFAFIADASGANDGERDPLQVMYASAGNAASSKKNSITSRATRTPGRSATAPTTSCSTTSGTTPTPVVCTSSRAKQIPEAVPVLKDQVEEAVKHLAEPDRGILEARGSRSTSRRARSTRRVALDREVELAALEGEKLRQQWRAIAEEIKADILAHGVDKRALTQRYGDDALDASLLLAVLTGSCRSTTRASAPTALAIADELTDDVRAPRYRIEETDADRRCRRARSPSVAPPAFGTGRDRRVHRARHPRERCCRSRACCISTPRRSSHAPAGIWATSQAFTDLALINAVVHVIRAKEESDSSASSWPMRRCDASELTDSVFSCILFGACSSP